MKKLKILFTVLLFGNVSVALAQESSAISLSGEELIMILLFGGIAALVLLIVIVALSVRQVLQLQIERMNREAGIEPKPKFSFQNWFWEKFNAAQPDREVLLDHNYDGILELDNRLPPWWKYGFYLCIIGAFAYLYVFYTGISPDSIDEYVAEVEQAEAAQRAYLEKLANSINESNVVALAADDAGIGKGKAIFTKYCKTCHGDVGQGGAGPNLTDEYWLHGGSINDVFKTIKYGVTEKGMQAWQKKLTPQDMQQVSSFILTLQGTNPPDGKEPQGEKYVPTEE
ncbi:MAG: cbb3-type cytochrome c oxidase N-terminal domain-containing protein [Bacteroidota bacterium]